MPQAKMFLSPRQQQIAALIIQGLPTKSVAYTLQISPWTVATYLRRLYVRLGVHSRAELVARLFEEGLVGNKNAG